MRKINLLIIFFLSLMTIPIVYGANVGTVETVYPNITLISQEPDPIEPGDFVDLRFKIDNRGAKGAIDFQFRINEDYPFSIYSGESIKSLGTLYSRQKGDKGIIVLFKVRVDENAAEGDNDLYVSYKYEGNDWTKLKAFKIRVRSPSAILAVTEVQSIPNIIPPGQKAILKIKIKNLAGTVLKDVLLKLDLSSVSFAPLGSTNEKVIEKIFPRNTETVEFNLISLPGATADIYKIPLRIDYRDESGANYSKTNTISLIIGEVPDMYAIIDSSTIYKTNTKGTISIKFVNKGNSDIKFLNAELKESADYDIISANNNYVGNIDSDDYENADFDLFVKADKKEIMLPLTIQYKDANNKDYSKKINLKLRLYSSSEAKKLGFVEKSNKTGIAIVVVIVVTGVFLYWKRKKKKK